MKQLMKTKKILLLLIGAIILAILIIFIVIKFISHEKKPGYFLNVILSEETRKEFEERKTRNFEMLELFPNNYEVYMDLGNIERELGNASKAIEYFTKAWEIIPTNSTPWLNIGNVYIRLKMYEEAEEAFLKAIDINNTYWFTYFNLAKLYKDYLTEKSGEVRGVYLEGLKNTNNDYDLLFHFTEYLIEIENYSEALLYLDVLLDKTPVAERQPVLERIEYVENLLNQTTQ